jgi:nonsense-mediated mRNA decay protein 3
MRAAINLYKAEQKEADGDTQMAAGQSGSGMQGGKRRQGAVKQAAQSMDVEDDGMAEDDAEGDDEGTVADDEEDFPEIDMDELLEHFEELNVENEEPQPGTESEVL